jgi:hypothetical protein
MFITQHLQGQPPAKEYQLKAVFLYNFTQFIDWPGNTLDASQSPFVIGIYGENKFGGYLEQAVSSERKNGRPIIIRYLSEPEEFSSCQMVFISAFDSGLQPFLAMRGILTVSDEKNFAAAGGILEFYTSDNKIKFKINLEAARKAGLMISSKLLRLAEIVK